MKLRLFITLILGGASLFAQKLDPASKKEIVNKIGSLLVDHYVYADTAAQMSKSIRLKLDRGAYNAITEPVVFADQLVKDLHAVYQDGHLLVHYNPAFSNQPTPNVTHEPGDDGFNNLREINFGFQKVELLPGNIGYINLSCFRADRVHGAETMKGAMKLVLNTRAVIIDLRSNGGGSQETATMLMSYFFPERTLVEKFYNRASKETTEYRTTPDSSFKRLWTIPVYILTSHKSFSCAEMFAYDMQALKRAIVVGETTGGGAHGQFSADATNGFVLQVPYWTSINPVTGKNWEKVGVQPDIVCDENDALEKAELEIFKMLRKDASTPAKEFDLNWQTDLLNALNHPVDISNEELKKFEGIFGDRTFTLEKGKLHYQRTGRPKFELEAMTATLMKGKNNNYFKIEFLPEPGGQVNKIKVYYQDNRIETAERTTKP